PVLAGRAQPILDPPAADQGCDVAARILQAARDQSRLGGFMPAEADDPGHPERARMLHEPVVMAIVSVEHGDGAGSHAGKQAGLLVGDRLLRAHVTYMCRLDIGDHADMRLDLAGQRRDRARLIGTPTWLLKLAVLAEVGAWADRMACKASLVLVLPAEPVTEAMRAVLRRRPARPRSTSAFMVSPTRIRLPDASGTSRETTAAAAPRDRASATKTWPSVVSPASAKNRSPLPTARLSKVTPVTSKAPDIARGASARSTSAEVQSALM